MREAQNLQRVLCLPAESRVARALAGETAALRFPRGHRWAAALLRLSDESGRAKLWLAMVAAVFAGCVAISHQSFWIDEVNAAWRAVEPSFARFLQTMLVDLGSDAQMPLFLASLWAWEKAVGLDEWALRAMNLLWFVPGLWFFANGRIERLLVASASAFVWYCLDEARPYGMQLGLSLLIFGLLERAIRAGSRGDAAVPLLRPYETWLIALGFIALAGSSLLGAIWASAAIAGTGLAVTWRRSQLGATRLWWPGVVLVLALIVLAAYYAWTLTRGARGTAVGGTGLLNVIFSGYELFGLAGLGPGRADVRTNGLAAFTPYLVPLALAAVCTGAVLVAGAIHIWRTVPRRVLVSYSAMLGGAAVLILAVGYVVHWRVVGRHLTPLLPLILAVQAVGLVALWRRSTGRFVVVAFLVLAFASAVSIRFAPRHAKDDYRSAAAMAKAALRSGNKVWWNADAFGALIYDVPLADGCEGATFLDNPLHGFADSILVPAVVISSKPDIYDAHGALAEYLERNDFRRIAAFMAFDIWTNPSAAPACQMRNKPGLIMPFALWRALSPKKLPLSHRPSEGGRRRPGRAEPAHGTQHGGHARLHEGCRRRSLGCLSHGLS